jgi:hypothetical protein
LRTECVLGMAQEGSESAARITGRRKELAFTARDPRDRLRIGRMLFDRHV